MKAIASDESTGTETGGPAALNKTGPNDAPAVRRLELKILHLTEELNRQRQERKSAEKEIRESGLKAKLALKQMINSLAELLELTDAFSADHQRRVSRLAKAIAIRLKLSRLRIEGIGISGAIHDLGKIAVPAEILSRPGKLNDLEMGLIRVHPEVGYKILKDIEFPWPVARTVHQHHERMDGSGYPRGLKGEGIILEARILGLADVVEAMSSHRPYRPALGIDRALEEITAFSGIRYDPAVVRACVEVIRKEGFDFNADAPASPGRVNG